MPKPRATLKQHPADFRVAEQIDFPLTGHGEHLWCYAEKTGLNTAWLKREWARLTGCPQKDIAHSGLKDRHAITRQWLSLPAKYGAQLPDSGDGWHILERQLNERKLRVGAHRHNQFAITLRATAYNAQLDARRAADALHTPQPGDRAMLAGSNSHFTIEAVDDALLARLASGDIALGGWLPGKEKSALPPAVSAWLESTDAAQQAAVQYLQKYADGGWRALTVRPRDLQYEWQDTHTLHLAFTLPRGSYATALLASIFALHDASCIKAEGENAAPE